MSILRTAYTFQEYHIYEIIGQRYGKIVAKLLITAWNLLSLDTNNSVDIYSDKWYGICEEHGHGNVNMLLCHNIFWKHKFPYHITHLECHGPIHKGSCQVQFTFFESLSQEFLEKAAMVLREYQIDLNQINKNGCTALMAAAKSGNYDMVRFLLSCKADISFENATGSTALRWAIIKRHVEIVKILATAKINSKSTSGYRQIVIDPCVQEDTWRRKKVTKKHMVTIRQLVDVLIDQYNAKLQQNSETDSYKIWSKLGKPKRTVGRHSSYIYVQREKCDKMLVHQHREIDHCETYPDCLSTDMWKRRHNVIIEHIVKPENPRYEDYSFHYRHVYEMNGKLYNNSNVDVAEKDDRVFTK